MFDQKKKKNAYFCDQSHTLYSWYKDQECYHAFLSALPINHTYSS